MINYFAEENRETPINLAVSRVILSVAMIWKLAVYQWSAYTEWPGPVTHIRVMPFFGNTFLFDYIGIISSLCILSLLCVLVGYRIRATAWVSSMLLTYLGGVRIHWWSSHQTGLLFTGSLLLLLFAIFAEENKFSVDQLRGNETLSANQFRQPRRLLSVAASDLQNTCNTQAEHFRHRALKWGLVVIGFHYFGSGLTKLIYGSPVEWIQPASLGRYILFRDVEVYSWPAYEILLQYPTLLTVGAVLTILLEVGFLPCILFRLPVWPFFIGLIGFHTAILVFLGPDFFDLVFLLCMFFPWDGARPSKINLQKYGTKKGPL